MPKGSHHSIWSPYITKLKPSPAGNRWELNLGCATWFGAVREVYWGCVVGGSVKLGESLPKEARGKSFGLDLWHTPSSHHCLLGANFPLRIHTLTKNRRTWHHLVQNQGPLMHSVWLNVEKLYTTGMVAWSIALPIYRFMSTSLDWWRW